MSGKENDPWSDDLIGVKSDALYLERFLTRHAVRSIERKKSAGYVLNVDAPWGKGKTFFLKRLAQQLESNGHLVATVNAWEDDYVDNPMLSVMAAIDDALAPIAEKNKKVQEFWQKAKRAAVPATMAFSKAVVKHWAKRAVGDGLEAINLTLQEKMEQSSPSKNKIDVGDSEELGGVTSKAIDAAFDEKWLENATLPIEAFRKEKEQAKNFKEFVEISVAKAVESEGAGKRFLFVLIDELDRCRPSYAIELLERVKHLFYVDGVIFVVATNTEELVHAISVVYGVGFDARNYLYRFFDQTYKFSNPTKYDFINSVVEESEIELEKFAFPEGEKFRKFLLEGCEYLNLSFRDIKQVVNLMENVSIGWGESYKIQGIVMIPLILMYQKGLSIKWSPNISNVLENFVSSLHEKRDMENAEWMANILRQGNRIDRYKIDDVLETAINMSKNDLDQNYNFEKSRYLNRYFLYSFVQEFRERGISPSNFSDISRYPEIIQNAGRFERN